jgi:CoA:oxalate CoA-transferase
MRPLDGVVVLDLTRVLSGPMCTMFLADLGANVIKIEPYPNGDDARINQPFVNGESTYFMSLNRGKRSIVLNLKKKEGKDIFFKMVPKADILVENFRPGTMEKLGLGYETLQEINERLIYCSISGFGQTGPYRDRAAYDIVIQAMSGIMSINGQEDDPPTRVGASIGDIACGYSTAVGILGALYKKQKDGKGQRLDVAMLDCMVYTVENAIARYCATGEIPGRIGNKHPVTTPFDSFPTKDGYIVISASNNVLWERLCTALGVEYMIHDPRFETNALRSANSNELMPTLIESLSTKTTDEWMDILLKHSVPCGPINSIAEVVTDPQVLSREMIVELEHKKAGKIRVTGVPIKYSETKCTVTVPPPFLGQHTDEILDELGFTGEEINSFKSANVVV